MPLLKRMAGSEFCSEAHRREYQHEYSQLALGRLLQSQPTETQAPLVKAPPLRSASSPAIDDPSATAVNGVTTVNGVSPIAKPSGGPAWAEKVGPTPPVLVAKPAGIAESEPPLPDATTTKAPSQPATAKPAVIQKPAPAELQFALVATPEFEHAFASLAPGRPRRQPNTFPAELPQGRAVALESGVEITDSITRPIEGKLELREVTRTTPRIALDLRIVPPESLEPERRPLTIPIALAEPAEASLWTGPHCDFAGELASLSNFADAQFSKSDFETPTLADGPAVTAVPALPVELPGATTPTVRVPDPEFSPLPVTSTGIAPGKAKTIPVFGPVAIRAQAVQIPQPHGLPLRPVMVLATAAAPATEVHHRKADALSLGPDLPIKPATPSSELNLGLPELEMQTPAGPMASRMRKIVAALAGAAVLGASIFFFLGKRSDAGLKSSTPAALADGALGSQWIANFAPDPQRQRRVSLLRSSMNLSAYRLDFESSIQIKALGWVYRAQDSKNFYVSKIEFQKPGQNPVYALVHYAVINGVQQPRVETPLHLSVPMGGLYKIRFEAVGNRFTTWVQDQQVEQWTDARLSSGGAGLYGEGVEQSILHGDFVVTPL